MPALPGDAPTALVIKSSLDRFQRHLVIIEVNSLIADDLICLVPFPGYEHNVALPSLIDRAKNSFTPVGQLDMRSRNLPQPGFNFFDDRLRIFGPWIVRCHDSNVAQTAGYLAHGRAFCFIAVTPAAKDSYHAAFACHFARMACSFTM